MSSTRVVQLTGAYIPRLQFVGYAVGCLQLTLGVQFVGAGHAIRLPLCCRSRVRTISRSAGTCKRGGEIMTPGWVTLQFGRRTLCNAVGEKNARRGPRSSVPRV